MGGSVSLASVQKAAIRAGGADGVAPKTRLIRPLPSLIPAPSRPEQCKNIPLDSPAPLALRTSALTARHERQSTRGTGLRAVED